MCSERPSLGGKAFDPADIPRYTVIQAKLPAHLGDDEDKLLVVVGHQPNFVVTVKATTKIDLYRNNRDARDGVVMYGAGEALFHRETAVDPENYFPVPYRDLRDPACVIGHLPADFHDKFVAAIKASPRLNRQHRAALLKMIGAE